MSINQYQYPSILMRHWAIFFSENCIIYDFLLVLSYDNCKCSLVCLVVMPCALLLKCACFYLYMANIWMNK